ncbi:MAG: hypothetical protein ABWK00_04000 [Desulfurococcaceae archaeon]
MDLRLLISERSLALALAYDIYSYYSDEEVPLHIHVVGEVSKLLRLGLAISRKGLWEACWRHLMYGEQLPEEIEGLLSSVSVDAWDDLEPFLRELADGLAAEFSARRKAIEGELAKVFGNVRLPGTIHVIMGFNPGKRSFGATLFVDKARGEMLAGLFAGLSSTGATLLDELLHQILHGVVGLNEGRFRDVEEDEEELLEALAPRGYLSVELGLWPSVEEKEDNVYSYILREYFNRKLYSKQDLLEYLRGWGRGPYI